MEEYRAPHIGGSILGNYYSRGQYVNPIFTASLTAVTSIVMKIDKSKFSATLKRFSPYTPAILIVAFVVWHLFIARNNYIDICRNDAKIRELEKNIAQEEALIQQLKEDISNTESDTVTINRIAREKHGMQQAHEDVYIIVPAPNTQQTQTNQDED